MASPGELYSFLRKFESLWKSGYHAKLYVETEASNAFVHLQVSLGKAQLHPHEPVGARRCGGPARQKRRLAARQATTAAE